MNIIGISAFFHNSACCLLQDGKLVAAAEEERFSRLKHDARVPVHAFKFCLQQAKLMHSDIDAIAYYEDPVLKLGRQLWTQSVGTGLDAQMISKLDPHLPQREVREHLGCDAPWIQTTHHAAHAASSFYYSGFEQSALLTVDGVGEWTTTSYGTGDNGQIDLFETVDFPHSLGLLYSMVTAFLGFKVNSGEYKVMGLAPYGKPVYLDRLRALVTLGDKGQYRLNLEYFDFLNNQRMFSERMAELVGFTARVGESDLEKMHFDLAASLQKLLEELMFSRVEYLHQATGFDNLCMAGGVALNCVANGKLQREGPFKRLFVQPAAGDAGGAVGAAVLAHVKLTNSSPAPKAIKHVFLGYQATRRETENLLKNTPLSYQDYQDKPDELTQAVAARLADGKVIAMFQGAMEFGPRALGNRSILADPRNPDMRGHINGLVKKRESFRPFAPVVAEEYMGRHFDMSLPSPFMLDVCQVNSDLDLPAITHVDGSARVQTVNADNNPRFYALLKAFQHLTDCPILLNTSLNMRGEAIVCTPEDALKCFVRAGIDTLVLDDFVLDKEDVPEFWVEYLEHFSPIQQSTINHAVYSFF